MMVCPLFLFCQVLANNASNCRLNKQNNCSEVPFGPTPHIGFTALAAPGKGNLPGGIQPSISVLLPE